MESTKNKTIIRNLYENSLNPRRMDLLNDVIADGYTGIRGEKGVAGFTETVGSIIAGFPDIKWTIEDLIAEGDKVTVRWSWKGTHVNAFRGIPPSHKQVVDNAIAIYQIKDGKIIQAWIQSDRLAFLTQIGVIPQDLIPSPPSTKQ
ncbi:ester cyclase [Flavitalea flava]